MNDAIEAQSPPDLRELVTRAFQIVRDSGRTDWSIMSAAVLKNRILAMTDRRFTERDYGHATFVALLESIPDTVTVDRARHPPVVRLIEVGDSGVENPFSNAGRVRPDLWRAVMDYRSGVTYGWDATNAVAVAATPESGMPVLPTVTQEVLATWRQDFVAEIPSIVGGDDADALQTWLSRGLGSWALPPQLVPLWNRFVTSRVRERLSGFFRTEKLVPPPAASRAADRTSASGDRDLREALHRLIDELPADELGAVLLPISAVMRLRRQR
jgi:hypothetical protein